MTDLEVALALLKLAPPMDPEANLDKTKLLELYRECLAAVRTKPE